MKQLLTFSFSLLTLFCFAQQQYTFTNYTQEQGLPSGTIRSIYKDTTGYLWLTNEGGLSRFDGYNFKIFQHNPVIPTGLPGTFVGDAAFPKLGDIYFGTKETYFSYNPATETFTAPMGDSVKIFYVDEAKDVKDCYWLRSKDAIYRISKTDTERITLPYAIAPGWYMRPSPGNSCLLFNNNKLFNNKIVGLLLFDYQTKLFSKPKILDRRGMEDSSMVAEVIFTGNNFYLFTRKSIFRFDSTAKSFVWYRDLKHTGNFDYFIGDYLAYNDTLVVIRSKSGFINILNIRTGEEKLVYVNNKIPETKLNDRNIISTVSDNNGGVWMGTNNMGLIYYNLFTGEQEQYIYEPTNTNSLPGNSVNWVMTDENGIVWASCFGYGIVKMEPVRALFKTAVPAATKKTGSLVQGGAWSENIRGFLGYKDGYLICTLDGLYGYSNQTREFSNLNYLLPARDTANTYINPEFSKEFPIGSVVQDHSGNLWIGTWYGRLVVYNTKLNRAFPILRSQPMKERDNEGNFRNLFCDSKNRMWISTKGAGVAIVNCNALNFSTINETKFAYNFFDEKDSTSLASGIAFVVNEDVEGNIWAGTENGLCRYNEQTKKWKRYVNIPGNEKSIHNNNIRSLCLDKKGTLWVGTNGGGLNRYNKEQDNFTHFTTENGLPNDQIYSLVCDDNGMLWMGTNHGLCRFNPIDYSCKNFSEKDGIQNYEYNTGAAIKLKDGTLLIGGIAGYNIIEPDKIENKKTIPPVVITSFKIFDKEIPIGNGHLKVNYDENSFTFEFAALSYFRNQKNRYSYMLEGVDHDWVFSDTRRYVTYSKLAPGHYTFKVKASNSDGVWNEAGTQMQITITPPWWQRTWFILLCFLVTIAIIYFINRYERNRKKQLEAVRARISRDLHDDMGSTLQSISVMSEIARMKSQSDNRQDSIPFIEKIGSASRDMVEKMNDIVWAVNPQNDNFENIILHMRAFGGELLAGKDIALHFKSESNLNNVKLSMEKRKSFFLVYKEALNNAYKYSCAKNVNVEISKTNHTLKLVVEDDGVGFNMNEDRLKTGGNGLKNMNTRAAELNGSISITSAPEQGTKISLTVNLS